MPSDHLTVMLATVNGAASYLAWITVSGLVAFVAIVRVIRRPAEQWKHANWSKLGWVLAAFYIAPIVGGYPIPVGAIAAIWRTTRYQPSPNTTGLPPVEGTPGWPLPWDTK